MIGAFQFFRRKAKRRINTVMLRALGTMIALLAAYLFLFDRFTFTLPTTGETISVGCGWSDLAKEVADMENPLISAIDLDGFESRPRPQQNEHGPPKTLRS